MNRSGLSIRVILLLTISALTLLIAVFAVQGVYEEWQRLDKITTLKNATRVSDLLFDATEKLEVERDIALSLLAAPGSENVQMLKPRLLESRIQADAAMNEALVSLGQYDFPELPQLQGEIVTRLPAIQSLRRQIDNAIADPDSSGNTALAKHWYDAVTGLSREAEDIWVEFVKHFADIDPIVTQHLRYKHFLRIISDTTAQERAIIGRLIVKNADPTPDEFTQLLEGHGAIQLSWNTAYLLANQSGLYPAISAYYTDAKSHYATLYDIVHEIFYLPGGRHGAAYLIGADIWLELSTEAAESLDDLKAASLRETRAYVKDLAQQSQRAIAMHLALLFFALALCAYSFWMITHRVINPINRIIAALLDTIEEKPVSFEPLVGNQLEEIKKLAQVLDAFRKNLGVVRSSAAVIAHNESRLRAVVDHTLDGLITISERGTIESFNPACVRIFGYQADEAIGQNVKMLMPAPYRGEHDGYLSRYVATGDPHIIGTAGREVRGRRKDGTTFPLDLSVSAFEMEDGRHFSGILRDITERKRVETELIRYMGELERSNQELDDFAYIASHDLKEPLRGLFNHATFLLEDYAEKLDEDGVRRLNRLAHLSQRMEHLVNDLLYFSRLGRVEMAIQKTDLNAVIADIEQMMEATLKEKNAHIRVPQKLPTIICDRPRVTEVFRNLITNAVKYNDKPERIVEVGFLGAVKTPQGLENSVFYVKDNGIGVAPEFHEEIFRIFRRLQRAAESKEDGTGVGLTFVKKIIERHKGRIWLESTLGQGTVFYFTLGRSGT